MAHTVAHLNAKSPWLCQCSVSLMETDRPKEREREETATIPKLPWCAVQHFLLPVSPSPAAADPQELLLMPPPFALPPGHAAAAPSAGRTAI